MIPVNSSVKSTLWNCVDGRKRQAHSQDFRMISRLGKLIILYSSRLCINLLYKYFVIFLMPHAGLGEGTLNRGFIDLKNLERENYIYCLRLPLLNAFRKEWRFNFEFTHFFRSLLRLRISE